VQHASIARIREGAAPATGYGPLPRARELRGQALAEGALLREWAALAAYASEPNPFLEAWCLGPALELLGPDAALLRVEFDGALIGVLPVARRASYYGYPLPHLAAWSHDNAFCGAPLVRRGYEAAFWQALLDWADRAGGAALFLHLPHLPTGGPLYAALRTELATHPRPAAVVQRGERALLASGLSPETYFEASMSGKKRKELRRQHARLAELGTLEFERREDGEGIAGWTDRFLALEQAGWKGQEGSALACDPANAAFFRRALAGGAGAGRLERLTLSLDGQPIAMLANFVTPPGAYSFKTAYDEAYARFSPGVLLQRENLALLARPGIAWADSCAAADHPMIERIWREKRELVHLSLGIGGRARRALAAAILRAETGHAPRGI
jgi:CelD/BcsL family acetyltransferase involved in cellulose biosynthesis